MAKVLGMAQQQKRTEFYARFPEFYADFEADNLTYGLYGALALPKATIEEIQTATTALWQVLQKAKAIILQMDAYELQNLGFDMRLQPYLKLDYLVHHTALSRFDFVVSNGEIKALELNNDTPFLVVETFKMNNAMCEELGVKSPNSASYKALQDSYIQALVNAKSYLQKDDVKIAVVGKAAKDDYEEFVTVDFIRQALGEHIEYIDIAELAIKTGDGLYNAHDEKIDILLRPAFPIEFMVEAVADDGEEIGYSLLDLVAEKKLAIINSPSAHILQSKMIFALIWFWHKNQLYLSAEEHDIVEKYMLPTYTMPTPFTENGEAYVQKTAIGREGTDIKIIEADAQTTSQHTFYQDFQRIYQLYKELPDVTVAINNEHKTLKYVVGSFVCNDEFAGMTCRVGKKITDWYSHWLSIAYEPEH